MKIVQQENKVLRETAQEIKPEEFGTPELKHLTEKMSVALAQEEDGVALAAPQIGVSKRVFVVSKKIFATEEGKEISNQKPPAEDLIFINPIITGTSRTKKVLEEGCLSVRWIYGEVKRAEKVTLQAQDLHGRKIVRHASGLLAQIFQHEVDHLNGTLFIDKAKNLQEIRPDEQHHHSH